MSKNARRFDPASEGRLVLSRHAGQAVRVGEDIVVRVLETFGNRTVLAFEAPRATKVLREELAMRDELLQLKSKSTSAA